MVREQNSKFAPAGYGLGDDTKYLSSGSDLDTITQCGFYSYAHNGVPKNGVTITDPFQYVYHLTVSRDANGTIVQDIVTCGAGDDDANYHIRRVKGFGGWSPWEYVNPPMIVGVEYRTTERWKGKPVYVKAINAVSGPVQGNQSIIHGITGLTGTIKSGGVLHNYNLPYEDTTGHKVYILHVDSEYFRLYSDYDWSTLSLYLWAKYTKD